MSDLSISLWYRRHPDSTGSCRTRLERRLIVFSLALSSCLSVVIIVLHPNTDHPWVLLQAVDISREHV